MVKKRSDALFEGKKKKGKFRRVPVFADSPGACDG